VVRAGVDPTLTGRALQTALRSAIATRRGSCDHAGWVVLLLPPKEPTSDDKTLEEALAWCLVWLMAPEIGVGLILL
jgi:hypothetical protein